MASTYKEKEQTTATSGYTGTSAGTQDRLTTLQQGYAPSQAVQNAQQQLNQVQSARPQAYNSQYAAQLDNIYQQIVNRQPFKYDMNGDMLYQNAKDQYVQGGRQAMMDTMGNAAALTGGYGNSYASTAGNQAYQQYLLQLNAMVPELYDRAAARYDQQGADMYNQYGLLQGRENTEYGRWLDTLNQWNTEMQYAQNAYDNAYTMDYNMYQDQLAYWQNQAAAENADYWAAREQAYATAMTMLSNGQMPSADLLAAAGISQADAQAMMPVAKKSSSGSGTKKTTDPAPTKNPDTSSLASYYATGGTDALAAGFGPVASATAIEQAYANAIGSNDLTSTLSSSLLAPKAYQDALEEELKKLKK